MRAIPVAKVPEAPGVPAEMLAVAGNGGTAGLAQFKTLPQQVVTLGALTGIEIAMATAVMAGLAATKTEALVGVVDAATSEVVVVRAAPALTATQATQVTQEREPIQAAVATPGGSGSDGNNGTAGTGATAGGAGGSGADGNNGNAGDAGNAGNSGGAALIQLDR